jgi:hypothetical protein
MAIAIGAALASVTLITAPAAASVVAPATPHVVTQGTETTIFGVLTVKDGVYTVLDWTLSGDATLLAPHVGGYVLLFGQPAADGTKTFAVRDLALAKGEQGPGNAPAPVAAGEKVTLDGIVQHQDLEGGFYAIDGYALVGDNAQLTALAGKRVVLKGTKLDGVSIQQTERIAVESVLKEVTAGQGLPAQVSFAGKAIRFDQETEVVDGTLMLPLRAVVEAAGGSVQWDEAAQSIHVEMPDRQASFWVGQEKAEMYQNNARYLQRNLIAMAKAPVLKNGRTMVSADALTQVLGLLERADSDAALDLASR